MLRKAAVPVVLVLLGSGIAFGFYWTATHQPDCPGHWHATYKVFDEGEELSFQHPRFDMRSMSMRTHIHQPKDYLMHLEAGCADVAEFFDAMGLELRRTSLELDEELHDGKTLANQGNMTLRFFMAPSNGMAGDAHSSLLPAARRRPVPHHLRQCHCRGDRGAAGQGAAAHSLVAAKAMLQEENWKP